ncbi:MAG TPA: DUF6308 family protein [Ilumatobacteraceae bacterium]|nr:DUF6308 family protein [Ilumatobacteraceae bacterium]
MPPIPTRTGSQRSISSRHLSHDGDPPHSRSGFTPQHAFSLEAAADQITSILTKIPTDVELHELTADRYHRVLDFDPSTRSSYGAQLWTLLDGILPRRNVAKSKLFARKRPALIPIHDSVVAGALGNPTQWWRPWWETLTTRNDIVDRLEEIRADATAGHLSLLRVADIVIWNRYNPRRSRAIES